jgi:hypothetical protein
VELTKEKRTKKEKLYIMIILMYRFFLFYKPKGRRGEFSFWR